MTRNKEKEYRGFRIETERLLDWYTIERPTNEIKSIGYRGKRLQRLGKKLHNWIKYGSGVTWKCNTCGVMKVQVYNPNGNSYNQFYNVSGVLLDSNPDCVR